LDASFSHPGFSGITDNFRKITPFEVEKHRAAMIEWVVLVVLR